MARLNKVVVTARAFGSTLSKLERVAKTVVCNPHVRPWNAEELCDSLHGADAALCFMTDRVDEALLQASPHLKLIACALKGYDNFDLAACKSRGVAVTAVPDLLTAPTAELAVALTLGLGRHVLAGDRQVRSGEFNGWRPILYGTGLAGSTVGLLGFGAVGRATAARLGGFGVERILFADPNASAREEEEGTAVRASGGVDELLRECDILIVCAPLNSSTHHLINRERLLGGGTKRGLLLVNISRGSCVDESAVADALDAGTLGGYAADVFELEDWALADRPRSIDKRLLADEARTLFTPHLGSAVSAVRERIEHAAAEEIERFASGEDLAYQVA